MATTGHGRSNGLLAAPERNHYFYGKLLDVQRLQMEQHYGIIGRRRINGLVLGPGVVSSLARVSFPLSAGSVNAHTGRSLIYSNVLLYELIVCPAERVGQMAGWRFLRQVSGDGQSGPPGQQLSAPLVLEVVDGEGNPMLG
jgi:hypothetical protein